MRRSGVLMHITSLPGAHGIGTMGKQAFAFVDFLKKAGQSCWQILPLTPTGYGDSPYQSCSTFAGNHYLIDLDLLVEQGLLEQAEVESAEWGDNPCKVDFGAQYRSKLKVLRLAYARFVPNADYEKFCRENSSWLGDYALFLALKSEYNGKPWYEWPDGLKHREAEAIWNARCRLKDEIDFVCFVQYIFYSQWAALRSYAHENNISIIGDVPIYVPLDSVDVWSNTELFQLNEDLSPKVVAGCPPDAFTEFGQLWGNPIYDWDKMKKDGYSWWLTRLAGASRVYDVTRMDHFRGFEAYWAVPAGDKTAQNGHWVKGPAMDFINTVKRELPGIKMIAEDLGFLTPEVLQLRDESGFPGMKVLGFAFDSREPSEYLPHNCIANAVCYTGTHDNMTTRQWFDTSDQDAVDYACEYMNLDPKAPVWGVIRAAMGTTCDQCIVLMQDLLELGGESRMNFPGTMTDANWTWRAKEDILSDELVRRLRRLTELYDRLGDQKETNEK